MITIRPRQCPCANRTLITPDGFQHALGNDMASHQPYFQTLRRPSIYWTARAGEVWESVLSRARTVDDLRNPSLRRALLDAV